MYHFTFGKFKDRLICDVFEEDPNYIAWITKKKWFKQKFTMEHKECLILMNTVDCPPIQSTDINDIIIYTDGACKNNGSKNARSGIGIHFSKKNTIEFNDVSEPFTDNPTNQRAELKAILEALRVVKELSQKIIIYTDSEYSINCIERWFSSWVSQNKLDEKKNIDLIRPAHLYYRHLRIEFRHINSHTGLQDEHSLGNEEADRLANLALN
jgi:ribonuclease HI